MVKLNRESKCAKSIKLASNFYKKCTMCKRLFQDMDKGAGPVQLHKSKH